MNRNRKTNRVNGIDAKLPPSDVGYVVIPNDVDRDTYVKKCISNGFCCIKTDRGDFHKDVEMSSNLLQEIMFPKKAGELGSCVVFITLPRFNKPFIVGVPRINNRLTSEHQVKLQKSHEDSFVAMDMSADQSSMSLSLTSNKDDKGVMQFNATNNNDTAVMKITVKGFLEMFSSDKMSFTTKKQFIVNLVDKDLETKAYISYEIGKGFTISDEYGNFITTRDNKISIGSEDESGYKAVLGDKLKDSLSDLCDRLNDICTALSILTVTCSVPGSPSSPPVNLASFVTAKTQISVIKANLEQFLSNLVTLD